MTTPLTVPQIATRYGVCRVTVRRWIISGIGGQRLKATRVGGRWMADENALAEFFAACTEQAVPSQTPDLPHYTKAQARAQEALAILRAKGMRV